MLVFVMGDSGIINVLLSLQPDVVDVLNEKICDVKQEEVAQRVERNRTFDFFNKGSIRKSKRMIFSIVMDVKKKD